MTDDARFKEIIKDNILCRYMSINEKINLHNFNFENTNEKII